MIEAFMHRKWMSKVIVWVSYIHVYACSYVDILKFVDSSGSILCQLLIRSFFHYSFVRPLAHPRVYLGCFKFRADISILHLVLFILEILLPVLNFNENYDHVFWLSGFSFVLLSNTDQFSYLLFQTFKNYQFQNKTILGSRLFLRFVL